MNNDPKLRFSFPNFPGNVEWESEFPGIENYSLFIVVTHIKGLTCNDSEQPRGFPCETYEVEYCCPCPRGTRFWEGKCTEIKFADVKIWGKGHLKTFDGHLFNLYGHATYSIMKSTPDFPHNFHISVSMVKRGQTAVLNAVHIHFSEEYAVEMTRFGESILIEKGVRLPLVRGCLLYTSPSPRDGLLSRMPSSA